MIAVTFALPAESSAFVRRLGNVRRDGASLLGQLPDQTSQICVLHTGVGTQECAGRLSAFLEENEPTVLISSGFCGAASDELRPGDLVIAQNYSDADLARAAQERVKNLRMATLFSADRVIDPAVDRYAIAREHGAMTIDMETKAIARLCANHNLPMLSWRVVTDSPAMPFPAPPQVLFDLEAQRTRLSQLLAYLARHPASAIRLARFSKRISIAKVKLAAALCAAISSL